MITLHATAPAISCFALPDAEYHRRIGAAEQLADEMATKYNNAADGYGSEILWHPAFPAEYIAVVSEIPLYEIGVWQQGLDSWANDKQPLDLVDYCFLADCLREGLASNPTPVAAQRLNRALAWVEQAGTALSAKQVSLTPAMSEAVPTMVASAA